MLKISKEFHDLMAQFEKDMTGEYFCPKDFTREAKDISVKGVYYANGEVNKLFQAYMFGYQNAKCLARLGEFD